MLNTPVAMLIFRRPETTERVFEAVARMKPRMLLVNADGPRLNVPGEPENCRAARAIFDRVDWDCEVIKSFSDSYLGRNESVSRGVSWIFESVEEAIILEDDCLPDPAFFRYCEELLTKYRDDEHVMHIAGSNGLDRPGPSDFSYFFSCLNVSSGWASWRRAWRHFDIEFKNRPRVNCASWLADIATNEKAMDYWLEQFDAAYQLHGETGGWDHQWTFACWANSGFSILPSRNLVSTVTDWQNAAPVRDLSREIVRQPTAELEFPLKHPPMLTQSIAGDGTMHRLSALMQRLDGGISGLAGPERSFLFHEQTPAPILSWNRSGCVPVSRNTIHRN